MITNFQRIVPVSVFYAICYLVTTHSIFAQTNTKETYQTAPPPAAAPTDHSNTSIRLNPSSPAARDGMYDKITLPEKTILPYKPIREADVFWQKRLWRVIDTRQKMNQPFRAAKQPFIHVLLDVVQKHPNEARIYTDDEFTTPTTFAEVNRLLGNTDSVRVVDPDTAEETWRVVTNDFDPASVTKFRIKEDWIFDQSDSRMVVRILGIAPVREVYDDNGELRGEQAMFWAYYPDFRQYLINYDTFNPLNDSNQLTWADLLDMRLFSSFISKETNVQDRRIQDYKNGRDALLESEEIKKKMLDWYENLWSY